MMTTISKWLGDVTLYANAGNLGEFMRNLENRTDAQQNSVESRVVKRRLKNGLAEMLKSNDNAYPSNVAHVR